MTQKFSGVGTRVSQLQCCQVDWIAKNDTWKLQEIPDTDFTIDADLVLLATGFLHVRHDGLVKDLGLQLDQQGNIVVDNCKTSEPWVFAAGDAVEGASVVVRAINSGRLAAAAIDEYLK